LLTQFLHKTHQYQAGKVTVNQNVYYLKLNTTIGGSTISAANFANGTITNSDSSVVAKVLVAVECNYNIFWCCW
jgi:hypothetical protein